MSKKVLPLTGIQVKRAKTDPKEVKLYDGGGGEPFSKTFRR